MKIIINRNGEGVRESPIITVDTEHCHYPYSIRESLELALKLDEVTEETIGEVFGRSQDKVSNDEPLNEEIPEQPIFLIEEAWIDPSENNNADGYSACAFTHSEDLAKDFCELQGYWTVSDCWSIARFPDGRMPKYRYKQLPILIR